MKTKININGNDVEITLTEEQVKQITEVSEPKLFEYEEGNTYIIWTDDLTGKSLVIDKSKLKYGRYRRTKGQAEMDFSRQTRMMRLSALAWELGECKKFVEGEENWYVYEYSKEWQIDYATGAYQPEIVYMTEETAIKVWEMLRSGEYSLDVDKE